MRNRAIALVARERGVAAEDRRFLALPSAPGASAPPTPQQRVLRVRTALPPPLPSRPTPPGRRGHSPRPLHPALRAQAGAVYLRPPPPAPEGPLLPAPSTPGCSGP